MSPRCISSGRRSKTLEGKEERARYKSQITLAGRRIEAFTIALSLIEREIENCE